MANMSRFERLVSEAKERVKEVSAGEARKRQAAGSILIDVRESDEFATEHAEGALPMSRGTLEMRIEREIANPSTPIICYCGGGMRSALAAESLQKMGYTDVASMAGGFKAWKQEGLPTA